MSTVVIELGMAIDDRRLAYALPMGGAPGPLHEFARQIPGLSWTGGSVGGWTGWPDAVAAFAFAASREKWAVFVGSIEEPADRLAGAPSRCPRVPNRRSAVSSTVPALRPYQEEGVRFLSLLAPEGGALLADDMGCVAGDTQIRINRAGGGRRFTLRIVYRKANSGRWRTDIRSRTRSLTNKGEIRLNGIRSVIAKGIRDVVRIETKRGKVLLLTPDHEVACADGSWIPAGELRRRQILTNGRPVCYVCHERPGSNNKYATFPGACRVCVCRILRHSGNLKDGKLVGTDGYVYVTAGVRFHPKCRPPEFRVPEHRLVVEAALNGMSYGSWMEVVRTGSFSDEHEFLSDDLQVHHKNRIRHDNRLKNLEAVSVSDHAREHETYLRITRTRWGDSAFLPEEDTVVSVRSAGRTDVYDVVVDDPDRNFVANGIIVHNCGKTAQALAAARNLIEATASKPVAVVICPAVVKYVWRAEAEKWLPGFFETIVLEGSNRESKENAPLLQKPNGRPRLVVLNYDVAHRWVEELQHAAVLIGDEAHALMNPRSRRSKAVKAIGASAEARMLLSGTPMTARPRDLWNLVDTLCPGRWGENEWPYLHRYCDAHRQEVARDTTVWITDGASNEEELNLRLRWLMLRRSKADVMSELPARIRQVVQVRVPPEKRMPVWREGWERSRRDALRRALSLSGSGKIKDATQLALDSVAGGHSVVLFAHLRETANRLFKEVAKKLPKGTVALATGADSAESRTKTIHALRLVSARQPVVLVATMDSLGVGVDLSYADVCAFVDLDWVPSKLLQLESRCVLEDQLVHTERGLIPVQRVVIGDRVLGHSGNWRTVTAIHSRYHRGLLTKIKYARFSEPLQVTHDHKVLVKRGNAHSWKPAHEVLPGDRLVMPRPGRGKTVYWIDLPKEVRHNPLQRSRTDLTTSKVEEIRASALAGVPQHVLVDRHGLSSATISRIVNRRTHTGASDGDHRYVHRSGRYTPLPRKIRLTPDLLYIFGWYLAEGWTAEGKHGGGHQVSFCGHIKESPILKRIGRFFSKWGLGSLYYARKNVKAASLTVYSVELMNWFKLWFGTGARSKHVPPMLLNLPSKQAFHLLRGYVDGDGYRRNGYTEWVSASGTLAAQMCLLALRCGKAPTLRRISAGKNEGYWIGGYAAGRSGSKYVHQAVQSVHTEFASKRPPIRVYDLTVEKDHSFVVGQAAVHNCHRHGQLRSVSVYYLIGIGTADEYVKAKVIERLDLYEKVIGKQAEAKDLGNYLKEFDTMSEEDVLQDLRKAVLAGEVLPEEDWA